MVGVNGPSSVVTFVVLATGEVGEAIAHLASEHAAFDPDHRRVQLSKESYGEPQIDAAALTLKADGTIAELLDERCALSEPWIEDAFVRARCR